MPLGHDNPDSTGDRLGAPSPIPQPYAEGEGTRYILPCAALHRGGLYEYVLVEAAQARTWAKSGPYVSYVTHPEWAWMLEQILSPLHGFTIPHVPQGTELPVMDYADSALVFVPDGGDIPGVRWDRDRTHSATIVARELFTLGLLTRLS